MQDIWNSVREGLGYVLAFFYDIIPNTGVAIILLTVSVRLILFPLTAKQAKSMIAMQRVQPEIKKLQAKYKNDRQKLNEEMMKFYKENNINPLGGCLPLVLQMPVFIALFQTLKDIQNFIPQSSQMYAAICGSTKVPPSKCTPNMHFAGMNLTKSASSVASQGFAEVLPYLVLVAIVVVTGFIQQRQTMRNQSQPNPQMAIIGKIFPIVFAFISWTAASGVALYFATTNIWQIGQQELVYRTIVKKDGPPPKSGGGGSDAGSGGDGPKPAKDKEGGGTATTTKPKPSGGGRSGSNGAAKGSGKSGTGKNGAGGGSAGTGEGSSPPNRSGQARSNRKRKR
jgi:YidC/Oxa1 family membrane protein insertase